MFGVFRPHSVTSETCELTAMIANVPCMLYQASSRRSFRTSTLGRRKTEHHKKGTGPALLCVVLLLLLQLLAVLSAVAVGCFLVQLDDVPGTIYSSVRVGIICYQVLMFGRVRVARKYCFYSFLYAFGLFLAFILTH